MAPCAQTIDITAWKQNKSTWIPSEHRTPSVAELRELFRRSLELLPQVEPHLRSAVRQLLERPGSMVRSRAAVQVASAFRADPDAAVQLAIGIEYFHTASLVFDDLPCMDDAVERRGAPTIHVAFGEPVAMLAGLALINRAYALAWQAIAKSPLSARGIAAEYLEGRLGLNGLLNGQSLDLHFSDLPHTPATTDRIALGKTASLIRMTLVLPAILGGAERREIRQLERLATAWGLGYQIVDDLRDVLQAARESGKTAARDMELDRPNSALVLGIPAAIQRLKRLVQIGSRALARLVDERPGLECLERLRADLEYELHRITNRAMSAQPKEV